MSKERKGQPKKSIDKDSQLHFFPPEKEDPSVPSKRFKHRRRRKPPASDRMSLVKALVHKLYASRQLSLQAIEDGRVSVDDAIVRTPNMEVDADHAQISVDGLPIEDKRRQPVTIIFNKPVGIVGSRERGELNVYNFIPNREGWYFPCGALPRSAGGLVIVSNDQAYADHTGNVLSTLTSDLYIKTQRMPTDAELEVVADHIASAQALQSTDVGVAVADVNARSTSLRFDHARYGLDHISVALKDVGLEILAWDRRRLGPFKTSELSAGSWRRLTPDELSLLEAITMSGIDDATSFDEVWKTIAQRSV